MKKVILSVIAVMSLTLALIIGLGTFAGAATVTTKASISLAEDITVNFEVTGLGSDAETAVIYLPNGQTVEQDVKSAPTLDGARLFTADIAVKHFDSDVRLTVVNANGVLIYERTARAVDDKCGRLDELERILADDSRSLISKRAVE